VQFIISRGFRLPYSKLGMNGYLGFNMWAIALWPYRELKAGDLLCWYESWTKAIVWATRVTRVESFQYENKAEAAARLVGLFGKFEKEGYFNDAPSKGFCLAYKVTALERLHVVKPSDYKFPQQGWLRADEAVARTWLGLHLKDDNRQSGIKGGKRL